MTGNYVWDDSAGIHTIGTLHHFAINSARLVPAHETWLINKVVPLLQSGGSVSLIGQTSRSGSAQTNMLLSRRRAEAVRSFLEEHAQMSFPFSIVVGVGETAAALSGELDGTEDGNFRSVVVLGHEAPRPPDPAVVKPKPRPRKPSQVWLGIGEVHSGDLVVVGRFNWNGRVYRMSSDPHGFIDYANLMSDGWKLGGGLGGSTAAVVIFAHGFKTVAEFKMGSKWSDMDYDIALGGNLGSVLKGVKGIGTVVKTMDEWKKLSYVGQELLKNKAFIKRGVYTIPIPGVGAGVHVWAGRKYGGIELYSSGRTKLH